MSYTPTEWKSGDVVTSAKLNKLEQGVAAGGAYIVTITGMPDEDTGDTVYTSDHTVSEIMAAAEAGQIVMAHQMYRDDPSYDAVLEGVLWLNNVVASSYADFLSVAVYSSGSAPQFSMHCARVEANTPDENIYVSIYDKTLS